VELLVVVAIIGVLINMLLPSLQSARRRSQDLACLNHLREIHMALMYYAQDHETELPPPCNPDSALHGIIYYLLGQNGAGQQIRTSYLDDHYEYLAIGMRTYCPRVRATYPGMRGVSYSLNTLGSTIYRSVYLEDISRADRTVLCGDSNVRLGVQWFDRVLSQPDQIWPSTAHNGGANYAFADGHVDSVDALAPDIVNSPPVSLGTNIFFRL